MHPIHHTFAPLADSTQVRLAWKMLFQPGKWRNGPEKDELKRALSERFNGNAHLFASGRESLLAILKSLRLKQLPSPSGGGTEGGGEEVIIQGYTCIVVPNAIIAAGMTPVYADIDLDTLNLDIEEVERLITPKTRAVICQHTFGIPAFAKRLRDLCDRHSLILIEDCAHIMPDETGPAEIGRHGDVMFFSFGRDKAISGVTGGAAICKRKDICQDLARFEAEAAPISRITIKVLLLYPIIYSIAKPFYGIDFGRAFLVLCMKLKMLVPILTAKEKHGVMNPQFHRMPNACAALALDQFHRLKAINDHRRMLARFYFEELSKRNVPLLLGIQPDLPLQKFPIFIEHATAVRERLKKHNIHLYDGWTGCVICPANCDPETVGYKDGDDPKADMVGQQILNLPTHPTMTLKDAERLVHILTSLLKVR